MILQYYNNKSLHLVLPQGSTFNKNLKLWFQVLCHNQDQKAITKVGLGVQRLHMCLADLNFCKAEKTSSSLPAEGSCTTLATCILFTSLELFFGNTWILKNVLRSFCLVEMGALRRVIRSFSIYHCGKLQSSNKCGILPFQCFFRDLENDLGIYNTILLMDEHFSNYYFPSFALLNCL